MTEPREIVLDLPQLRLAALEWGPADGRLALCVHGFPDSAHGWRLLAPLLADNGFRVVAPFMRGYAPTGPAPDGDYTLGALTSDLIAAHRYLGAPPDAVLIGHDWGGWATGSLAAFGDSPFAAHIALALATPGAMSPPRGRGLAGSLRLAARQLRNSWYIMFFQLPWLPQRVLPAVIPRLWKDWSPTGADVRDDVATTLAALPDLAERKAAVSYYRANMKARRARPRYRAMNRFRYRKPVLPLLLVYGDCDGAIEADFLDPMLTALPAGSRSVMIPGAGHFLQIDRPEATCAAILDYLGHSGTSVEKTHGSTDFA